MKYGSMKGGKSSCHSLLVVIVMPKVVLFCKGKCFYVDLSSPKTSCRKPEIGQNNDSQIQETKWVKKMNKK